MLASHSIVAADHPCRRTDAGLGAADREDGADYGRKQKRGTLPEDAAALRAVGVRDLFAICCTGIAQTAHLGSGVISEEHLTSPVQIVIMLPPA